MLQRLTRVPHAILRRLGLAKRTWKDVEQFDEFWRKRIQLMAGFIPGEAQSVLDVGCGKMWLKDYLPSSMRYFGMDYVDRGDGCLVCNLNRKEFPDGGFDVVFVSGCLEYVEDHQWFLRTVAEKARMRVLLSYCVLDHFNNLPQRRASAWVTDLTEAELLRDCEAAGLKLITKLEAPAADRIYVLEPVARAKA